MTNTFISRLQKAIGDNSVPAYLQKFLEQETARRDRQQQSYRPPSLTDKHTVEVIKDLYKRERKVCGACPFVNDKQENETAKEIQNND